MIPGREPITSSDLVLFKDLLESLSQDIGGTVELLLRTLDPNLARLIRLAAIPHRFDPEVIRVLEPTLPAEAAKQYFETISSLSVAIPAESGTAWHDEPRRYLFSEWLAHEVRAEFTATSARLADYFGALMETASEDERRIYGHRQMFHSLALERPERMAEFERLFRFSRQQNRLDDCESLIALVHEYDAILTPEDRTRLAYQEAKLAADRRNWPVAMKAFETVIAEPAAPPRIKIKARSRLGSVLAAQFAWDAAIREQTAALYAAQVTGMAELRFRVLHELAVIHRDCGNRADAEKLLRQCLNEARPNSDYQLALVHNSLGTLYRKANEPDLSAASYSTALEHLERSKDSFGMAQVLHNLGLVHADKGDFNRSEEYLNRSLTLKRRAADRFGEATTLTNLVRVYWMLGRPDAALTTADLAVRVYAELKEHYQIGMAERVTARLLRGANRKIEALVRYQAAVEAFSSGNAHQDAEETKSEADAFKNPPRIHKTLLWSAIFIAFVAALFIIVIMYGI
jgi:tetratricopeptide (TPR) repeat protein